MALFIPDMAGHLFLVILLLDTFQYIEAQGHYQDFPPPSLTVSSAVINERDSVQLSCETPPSLHVSQCYFYIEAGKNLTDSSCTHTLTGTELFKRADPTFPDVVKLTCYYTVWKSHTSPLVTLSQLLFMSHLISCGVTSSLCWFYWLPVE
ncbi:uncharacterized protein ACWYII_039652 isoform 1-T1 [Salvelinus alpinus]